MAALTPNIKPWGFQSTGSLARKRERKAVRIRPKPQAQGAPMFIKSRRGLLMMVEKDPMIRTILERR
jgi:hypothetical protein